MLRRSWLEQSSRSYAGGLQRSDPRISPLFADLATLPPTLIQVGSDEILLDDSIRFADRAWAAGAEVELQRFEGWWHDFQGSAGTLRVARDALVDVAGFLNRRLGD
jgi:acetyl esterase/lipase